MSDWFPCRAPNGSARLRLLAFPHAGGGASAYRLWHRAAGPEIEFRPVQYPGRENRIGEPLIDAMAPLVDRLADALADLDDRPFAFYGHSLGGLVAFELACELRRRGARPPIHLAIGARRAPDRSAPETDIHHLPDDAFVDEIQERYGAIPAAVLAEPEMMALFIPVLRADFTILETRVHRTRDPLDIPLTAFAAVDDDRNEVADVEAWRGATRSPFEMVTLDGGGHFFHQTRAEAVLAPLVRRLAPTQPAP